MKKKLIVIAVLVLIALGIALFLSPKQKLGGFDGGVNIPLWKVSANGLYPVVSTFTIGNSGNPVGSTTYLTNLVVTGNCLGCGDVITGSSTAPAEAAYFVATSSTASVFPYASSTSITSSGYTYLSTSGGFTAIGTTSPYAFLSLSSGSNKPLVIATSTGAELYSMDSTGMFTFRGDKPSVSSCGTGGYILGTDSGGTVFEGTSAGSSCTVTFAYAHSIPPNAYPQCVVTQETGTAVALVASSTVSGSTFTGLVISSAGVLSSDNFAYKCFMAGGK